MEDDEPKFEYTVRYGASSNISFHNEHSHTWELWDGDGTTIAEVEQALYENQIPGMSTNMPLALEQALEASGFDWWVEVREKE